MNFYSYNTFQLMGWVGEILPPILLQTSLPCAFNLVIFTLTHYIIHNSNPKSASFNISKVKCENKPQPKINRTFILNVFIITKIIKSAELLWTKSLTPAQNSVHNSVKFAQALLNYSKPILSLWRTHKFRVECGPPHFVMEWESGTWMGAEKAFVRH